MAVWLKLNIYDEKDNKIIKKKRKEIQEILFTNKKKVVKHKKYQAGIYLVGIKKYNAWHSSPNMNKSRLFIAILPGKKKEVKKKQEMYKKLRLEHSSNKNV